MMKMTAGFKGQAGAKLLVFVCRVLEKLSGHPVVKRVRQTGETECLGAQDVVNLVFFSRPRRHSACQLMYRRFLNETFMVHLF